jgi:hypothetical protein
MAINLELKAHQAALWIPNPSLIVSSRPPIAIHRPKRRAGRDKQLNVRLKWIYEYNKPAREDSDNNDCGHDFHAGGWRSAENHRRR